MGKKRRAINRINKFGKKAFNFLDKVDGVDDGLLSLTRTGESRAEIKDFTLTDNENQTIAFVTSVFGSATHVQYDSDAEGKAVTAIAVTSATGAAAASAQCITFNNKNNDGEFTILVPKLAGGSGKKVTVKFLDTLTADGGGSAGRINTDLADHTIEIKDSDDATNVTNFLKACNAGAANTNYRVSADLDSGIAGITASATGTNQVTLTADNKGPGGNKIKLANVTSDHVTATLLTGGSEGTSGRTGALAFSDSPAVNTDGTKVYTPGNHFIDFTIIKDGTTVGTTRVKFHVKENRITTDTTKFANDTNGNITLTTAEIFSAGKISAGSSTDVSDGSNGFKIEAVNLTTGAAVNVATAVADIDKTAAANLAASVSVLQAALTEAGTIRLTITPKTAAAGEALLTESTVSVDIPVTV